MGNILTAENLIFMVKGAGVSLILAVGAVVIGCVIGIVLASAKLSKVAFFRFLGSLYVEIVRGTPMLLQILFFYLGVPVLYQRITGTRMHADPYIVGLIALSVNSGAYQTELIRAGIQSVDRGQWEAGETLGLPYHVMMKEVILPQAFRYIIPPLVSEFITLIKDSSLISSIGAIELLYSAEVLGKEYYDYLDPILIAAVMYLTLTLITSRIAVHVERRMTLSD